MFDLINSIYTDTSNPNARSLLASVFYFYDEIQYSIGLETILESISQWFFTQFGIFQCKITMYNSEIDENSSLFSSGDDFFPDDDYVKNFVLAITPKLTMVILIKANDILQFNILEDNSSIFNLLIILAKPIIKDTYIQKELANTGRKDYITGFYNRKYLDAYLAEYRYDNLAENKLLFLMVEIDKFKAVIDEFGYKIADKVMVELAKIIRSTVDEDAVLIKLSGYDLLVILNSADVEKGKKVGQTIIEKFKNTEVVVNEFTDQTLRKTVCIGMAVYPDDGSSELSVIYNAAIALDEARNISRGSFLQYDKSLLSIIDIF